uniref:Uncharacterized protein n=2 Tax=Plectus sambesii TaxID=2011161 RepID=A0A914UKE5_9BILA
MESMVVEEWKKYGACPLDRLRSRFEERWNANWQFVCGLKIFNALTVESGITSYADIGIVQFRITDRNGSQVDYHLLVLRTSPMASGQRKTDGSLCVQCKDWNEKADQPKGKSNITVTTKFWLDEYRQTTEKDLDLAVVVRRVRQKHFGCPTGALRNHFGQRWNTTVQVFCGRTITTSINAVTTAADSDRLDMVLFEIKEPNRPVYQVLIVRTAPMNYGFSDIFMTEDY